MIYYCNMKQLYFLLLFTSFSAFSQSLDLGNLEQIKKTHLNKKKNQLYVFYSDSISVFDLEGFQKILNIDIKEPSETFYIDHELVTLNSEIRFIERLGGQVYKLEDGQIQRMDNSYTHRMQIRSTVFTHKDTIYRFGGYGFWSLRNFFTYYKDSTREWEIVAPTGSQVFPPGLMWTKVKPIEDHFYVYGGKTLNESNPTENEFNNEVWKFDLENNSWTLLGSTDFNNCLYNTNIPYAEKHIFMDEDKDELYLVDIVNNSLKTFQKKAIHRRLIPTLKSEYLNGVFYLFVLKATASTEVQLVPITENDFFGELVTDASFYANNDLILYVSAFLAVAAILIFVYFQLRKLRRQRNRIVVSKDEIVYKRKSLDFDDKSIMVINLLLRSKGEVQYKDILEITENSNLNYAHNTKVMNTLLDEINFKLKSVLQLDLDLITNKKSDQDKRVKVYSIEKSYFFLK